MHSIEYITREISGNASDTSWTPEGELILLCSRTRLTDPQIQRIFSLLEGTINWENVFNIANRNGLFPLLSWNLLGRFANSLTPEVSETISEFLRSHTKKNFFLTLKLIEIVKLLEADGIQVLPFKGTTLAAQAYQNLALRQYVDLDMLVQPRHFDRAAALLQESGYLAVNNASWIKRKSLFFTRKKDIGLMSADGLIRIELHWKLSGSHFALPLEINQLWNRLESLDLGGSDVKVLPFEDLFVYLCLHGSRHGWEKFSWICDLNELIEIHESKGTKIDWTSIRHHARKHGCEKVLELGLFLVQEFFGRQTNYPDMERVTRDGPYIAVANGLREKAFSPDRSSNEIGEWYLYHLMLKERRIDRIKVRTIYLIWYLKLAFRPNELDQAVFHLPDVFFPLYYILRPLRLIGNQIKMVREKSPVKPEKKAYIK